MPAAFTSVYDMWRKWTSRPMPLLLNSLVLMEPRQPEAVWTKLRQATMPPALFEFAHQALWRKLRTLPRLQPWLHEPGLCPICNTPETHEHVLTECKYLKIAVKVISQCFADYRHGDDTLSLPQLTNSPPDVLLSAPVGPVVWFARWASWQVRCIVRSSRDTVLPHTLWSHFLSRWVFMIRCVASFHDQQYKAHLHYFLHALESLEDNGTLKHPLALVELSQPLTKAQIKAKKRKANKEDKLQQELQRLNWFLSQGYVLVYTDGSSKRYDLVGWVGGFGIFVGSPHSVRCALPIPREFRRTNDGAEL